MAQALLLALGPELIHLGLDKVGGAAGDDLVIAYALLADLLVHRAGQLAVLASQEALGLFGDHLVPLAGQYVQHRLRANYLAGGSYQRREAEVLADTRNLLQHLVILVLGVGLLQLADEVREHTAGHLVQKGVNVHLQHFGVDVQLAGHVPEVCRGL